ncbi:hypothetical protein JXI42_01140 [bacterium]|nr:hypothetical protein [bacterium]
MQEPCYCVFGFMFSTSASLAPWRRIYSKIGTIADGVLPETPSKMPPPEHSARNPWTQASLNLR